MTVFRRRHHRFELGLAAWLVLGIPVFLVQHWWIYTYAMFLVPVGVLAGYGLDIVAGAWPRLARAGTRRRRRGRGPPARARGGPALAHRSGRRVARVRAHDPRSGRAARRPRAELRAGAEVGRRAPPTPHAEGAVYVLGNPLYLYLADRTQAVSINGWSPEQYPQDVWQRLRTELAARRPVLLVVDEFSRSIMDDRSRETKRLINRLYEPYAGVGTDVWYRLRQDPGGSSGTPST